MMHSSESNIKTNNYGDILNLYFENGILVGEFAKDLDVDLKTAKRIVQARKEISNYQPCLILVDVTSVKSVSKEARDYFGSKEGSSHLIASAIYSNSKLSNFLANFLIKVNLLKSEAPIKLFDNREKAMKWLEQFK